MRIFVALVVLSISQAAMCCPDLIGTWKSSKEMSMEYNEKYAQLEPRQKELLVQILGHMKVTYTEKNAHEHGQEPIKVKVAGKDSDFTFEDLSYPYTVLSCDQDALKVEYEHPYSGVTQETIHFVGKNTYWLSPEMLPSTREYFVRVSN